MSGAESSGYLLFIGMILAVFILAFDRPKIAVTVLAIFSAPVLVRLLVAAVAS